MRCISAGDDGLERVGGVAVRAGDGLGVAVERGRRSLVIEPAGDNWERDAGVEHLGSHEVAQIMESELAQPRGPAVANERFGGSSDLTVE